VSVAFLPRRVRGKRTAVVPQGFQKSVRHAMQHQPSAKMLEAAITSKPDAF